MTKRNVKIKFQYFIVNYLNPETNKIELFDLREWISQIREKPMHERIYSINGILGRLEDITVKKEGDAFYGLRFMRMDVVSDSYKLKIDKRAEHIDLEDDEYIGKSTDVLYDPHLHVLMVQNNRRGFSFSSIENYIYLSTGTEDKSIFLRPISTNYDTKYFSSKKIRKIQIKLAETTNFKPEKSKNFKEILRGIEAYNGVTATVEIGLGRAHKEDSMDNQTILETVDDLKNNRDSVSSARLTISDDDRKASIIDIFDDLEHDFINITIKERGELQFDEVFEKMSSVYRGRARNRISKVR